MLTKLCIGDECLGKVEFVGVRSRRLANRFIEVALLRYTCFLHRFLSAIAAIESNCPFGKFVHVIGGTDEAAGLGVDPEGAVGCRAGGQNGGTVFERYAIDLGVAASGQP